MKVANQSLQLVPPCGAPTLKPRERVMMEMREPFWLAVRTATQTNPEMFALTFGKHHDAPIFLT